MVKAKRQFPLPTTRRRKTKGGSILASIAGAIAGTLAKWGLNAIKERIAAKKGGKIEPKDWIHFAMGPWGWLHLGLRERDRKKYKEEQKKLKGGWGPKVKRLGLFSDLKAKADEIKARNEARRNEMKRLREENKKLKSAQAETITGSGDGIRWFI